MIDTAAFLCISITTIVRAVHSSISDLHYDHVRVQKLIEILNELDLVFCAAPYHRVHRSEISYEAFAVDISGKCLSDDEGSK